MQVRLLVRTGSAALFAAVLAACGGNASETSQRRLCRLSQLGLTLGQELTAVTGHNPFTIHLTNRGAQSCVVNGYPAISFNDARGSLPFVVNHGGDQQVASRPPERVSIRPGRTAFVVMQKYRCDFGKLRVASTLRLALPGGVPSAGTVVDLSSLGSRIAYCRGGSTVNAVSVSPFVPSIAAGLRH
ncbi:MAG: DUF4232 domain-containing protein [Gaiellaceae bacterium]